MLSSPSPPLAPAQRTMQASRLVQISAVLLVILLVVIGRLVLGAGLRDLGTVILGDESKSRHVDNHPKMPCNLLGRSSFHFRERPTSAQILPSFNGGRTGNLFFTLGANIVHVLDQNFTPLVMPSHQSRRYNYLPTIVNSSMYQSNVTLQAPSLGAPYYQTRHYSMKFHQYRDELCYYMAMKPF